MLSREMKNLKNLSKVRRDRLVEVQISFPFRLWYLMYDLQAIQAHEYKRESEEFRAWIGKIKLKS